MLSKAVSSTIFKIFGMTRPRIEARSPGPLDEHSTNEANEPVLDYNFLLKNKNLHFKTASFCIFYISNWGSIPDLVIPKNKKMVLDASLFNIQYFKVRIMGKVEQSREWSSAFPYISV